MLRTELLTELGGTDRTDFDAFSAGDAFFFLDMRAVSGCGQIRRIVQLRCAQRVADSRRTVADRNDFVFAVDVGDLVHVTVTLGSLENFQNFIVGEITPHASLDTVLRHIANADAVFSFNVAASLTACCLLLAACADADGIFVIFVQPVRDVLDGNRLALVLDSLLDRNDMHTDACSSRRHHLRDTGQRQLCHQIKKCKQLRMLVRQLIIHDHELSGARDENRNIVHLFPVAVLAADHLKDTGPGEVFHHFLRILHRHIVHLCELADCVWHTRLLE